MPALARMLNGSHCGHRLHLLYLMSNICRPASSQHPIGGTPHHQSTHHQLNGKIVSMSLLLVVGLPALVRQYPWRVLGFGFLLLKKIKSVPAHRPAMAVLQVVICAIPLTNYPRNLGQKKPQSFIWRRMLPGKICSVLSPKNILIVIFNVVVVL